MWYSYTDHSPRLLILHQASAQGSPCLIQNPAMFPQVKQSPHSTHRGRNSGGPRTPRNSVALPKMVTAVAHVMLFCLNLGHFLTNRYVGVISTPDTPDCQYSCQCYLLMRSGKFYYSSVLLSLHLPYTHPKSSQLTMTASLNILPSDIQSWSQQRAGIIRQVICTMSIAALLTNAWR